MLKEKLVTYKIVAKLVLGFILIQQMEEAERQIWARELGRSIAKDIVPDKYIDVQSEVIECQTVTPQLPV